MAALAHVTPLEPAFPSRLRALADPPPSISLRGGPVEAACAVAVIGSRKACGEALAFARDLSTSLVRSGAVVVSGGAMGIDAAAHEGALGCEGRTWVVAGTGHDHCFPPDHAALFERVAQGPGAMVWPFAPGFRSRSGFLSRNRVLVALSDAVVVVQAGDPSGALHAASWARRLGKPLWVVPAAPWMEDFAGSRRLLLEGARPLTAVGPLLAHLGLAEPDGDLDALPPPVAALPDEARAVFRVTSDAPLHVDALAASAGLSAQATAAALLTLALENVVVEAPSGFFRRAPSFNARK